jgi:hypothetical protein
MRINFHLGNLRVLDQGVGWEQQESVQQVRVQGMLSAMLSMFHRRGLLVSLSDNPKLRLPVHPMYSKSKLDKMRHSFPTMPKDSCKNQF